MTPSWFISTVFCRKVLLDHWFGVEWVRLGIVLWFVFPASASEPLDNPVPGDDAIYRPTVMVRKGPALGTGVVIASVEGETLILTAAHVVEDPGPLYVELFRYNFGWERSRSVTGFPRKWGAKVAALDRDTDLAVLRVGGQLALPYVARIAEMADPILPGAAVTSIGFDRGERLIGFPTRIRRIDQIDIDSGGGARPFLITENPPVVGRSGGGLFQSDGSLVGVCLARAQLPRGPIVGMYSTVGNIRRLLQTDDDLIQVVARSHAVGTARIPSRPRRRLEPSDINRTGDQIRANE